MEREKSCNKHALKLLQATLKSASGVKINHKIPIPTI
ncbi:ribosomal protein L23A [Helicobacter pylori v225d]|nr:ribosomal protein L23A [Helicobacter pylori v225d]